MSKQVYLKQNAVLEPLFSQWYAWSYLMSPPTAAMYTANLCMKIMRSFVTNPSSHAQALQNPAMKGGPFINYGEDRAEEIKRLMDKTEVEHKSLLDLAQAIKSLAETVNTEATGDSLEPLYQKVPECLKGYVELVYNINNAASVRFIEGLLYRSRYYDPSLQSLALSLLDHDERSFVLSTPRLEGTGGLHLKMSFCDGRLDELMRMRSAVGSYERIKDLLEIDDRDDALFSNLFTERPARPNSEFAGDGIRIRYMGHACVLIESGGMSILTDPLLGYKIETGIPRFTFEDLPEKINYALITHHHQDHCVLETLLQLRHKIGTIVVPRSGGGSLADPSMKLALAHAGFKNIVELDELEQIGEGPLSITGLPFLGEHGDLDVRTKLAYLVTLSGRSMLLAADSNNIEPRLYQHIKELIKNVEVLFIGMECDGAPMSWLYSPLMPRPLQRRQDQSRRLDGSDSGKAINIVDQLKPKQVYVYAMGQEPWLTFITTIQYTPQSRPIIESDKLVQYCRNQGIVSERLLGKKEIILT